MNIEIHHYYTSDFATRTAFRGSLARKCWRVFVFDNHTGFVVRLNSYAEETRQSPRHRTWTVARGWGIRRSTVEQERMPKPESIPADVLADVHRQILATMRVEIGSGK